MLEDVKNTLPEELSERFSLNRFFAFQRDIINDELQSNVPFLIEDALDNPTGTYKQISRFQNEKLMDIDRTGIRIEEKLDDILGLIGKMPKGGGGGDSIWDDFFDFFRMFGMGGRGRRGAGDGRKGKVPDTEAPKKRKSPTKKPSSLDNIKEFGNSVKKTYGNAKRVGGWALGLVAADTLYDIATGRIQSTDDLIEKGKDIAQLGTFIAGDTLLTNYFYDKEMAKTAAGAAPTAAPAKAPEKIRRYQLDPSDPRYLEKGSPKATHPLQPYEFVKSNATAGAGAAPSTTQKFFNRTGSVLSANKNMLKSSTKSNLIMNFTFSLTQYIYALRNLPPDMSDEEMNKAVAELTASTIADVGIGIFAAFVADLVWVAASTLVGVVVGGPVGGVLGGIISSAIIGYVSYVATDRLIGEDVRKIMSDPEVVSKIKDVVGWVRASHEFMKNSRSVKNISPGMQLFSAVLPFAVNYATRGMEGAGNYFSNQTAAGKGNNLSRAEAITQGRNKKKSNKNPASANMNPYGVKEKSWWETLTTPWEEPDNPMADPAKAASAMWLERNKKKKEESSTDWLNPLNMMGSIIGTMAGDPAKGQAFTSMIGGQSDAIKGLISQYDNVLSADTIFGEGATDKFMKMVGAPTVEQIAKDGKTLVSEVPKMDSSQAMAEHMDQIASAVSSTSRQTPSTPAYTTGGFPQATSTPLPTSLAIVALRGNGMADVYVHPQSGSTMERMDRGGETFLG